MIKVLPAKTKLDTIEILMLKALINSYNDQGQFVSVNNVLRENNAQKTKSKS